MELENIILSDVAQTQKTHTCYVLNDKWMLAPKHMILMIQLTDHMRLKKQDQNVDASVLLGNLKKIIMRCKGRKGPRREIGGGVEKGRQDQVCKKTVKMCRVSEK